MNPFVLDKMRRIIEGWHLGNRTEAAQMVRGLNKANTVELVVNPHKVDSSVVSLSKEDRINFEDFVLDALNNRA